MPILEFEVYLIMSHVNYLKSFWPINVLRIHMFIFTNGLFVYTV